MAVLQIIENTHKTFMKEQNCFPDIILEYYEHLSLKIL